MYDVLTTAIRTILWCGGVVHALQELKRDGNITNAMDLNGSGTTSANTDNDFLMLNLCNQFPGPGTLIKRPSLTAAESDGLISGAYNVVTGEFKTWGDYMHGPAPRKGTYKIFDYAKHPVFEPVAPWEIFQGYCTWQVSASWNSVGAATVISDPVANNSPVNVSRWINSTYTSSPQFSVSVGSYPLDTIQQYFSLVVDPNLLATWSWEGTATSQRATFVPVEACTEVTMTFEPNRLSIRAVMVFTLLNYQWAHNPKTIKVGTWRGLGSDWASIYSSTYFIEGDAELLLDGNQVAGTFAPQDQPLTSGSCS
jgi:hypothetical protein